MPENHPSSAPALTIPNLPHHMCACTHGHFNFPLSFVQLAYLLDKTTHVMEECEFVIGDGENTLLKRSHSLCHLVESGQEP